MGEDLETSMRDQDVIVGGVGIGCLFFFFSVGESQLGGRVREQYARFRMPMSMLRILYPFLRSFMEVERSVLVVVGSRYWSGNSAASILEVRTDLVPLLLMPVARAMASSCFNLQVRSHSSREAIHCWGILRYTR